MSNESKVEPLPTGLTPDQTADLTNYGIVKTQVDYFHVQDFRYTNVNDAIAQAKRLKKFSRETDSNEAR